MAKEKFTVTLTLDFDGEEFEADPLKHNYEHIQRRIAEAGNPRAAFFLEVLGFGGEYSVDLDLEYSKEEQEMINAFYAVRELSENEIREATEEAIERTIKSVSNDASKRVRVYYSNYDENDDGSLRSNIYDLAHVGKCQIAYDGSDFFGNGKDYLSPVLFNPQFLEVAAYANEAIEATGDGHHVFFEGLRNTGITQDGVPILKLIMGS